MTTYTYSNARQALSKLLDIAKKEGKVLIKRRDGTYFSAQIEPPPHSPLDVEGIKTNITTQEIIRYIRKSRQN